MLTRIKETFGLAVVVIGFILIVVIASSTTTFFLMEQFRHNYNICTENYYRAKVTIGGKSFDYYIDELYEDFSTYKIVDDSGVYHIVYKTDCEFYGKDGDLMKKYSKSYVSNN